MSQAITYLVRRVPGGDQGVPVGQAVLPDPRPPATSGPDRIRTEDDGDDYGNRIDRFLATVARALMYDRQYRMGVATQNVGYNHPIRAVFREVLSVSALQN